MLTPCATETLSAVNAKISKKNARAASTISASSILIASILLLASTCLAQVQGNRPELIDSYNGLSLAQTSNPKTIVMGENVAINDTIDVCVNTFDGLQTAYGVTDSLGNTYTLTTGTPTPSQTDTKGFIYHAYTRSAFAGADTITVAIPNTSLLIGVSRYSGLNGVDGSVAVATRDRPVAGIATLSTTNTTTVNGDVLSSCTGSGLYNQDAIIQPNTNEYNLFGAGGSGFNVSMQHQHAGALGSQTSSVNTFAANAFNGPDTFAMQTLAFKPDAIKLTDTVMPDGANGVAYSAQLHGVGGTAGLTYACTGLPANGLSLNTSTGAITGTATTGTVSIGCTVTDGVNTSVTDNLTIHIYASLFIPTVRATFANSGDPNGAWQTISTSCNDYIVVFARGVDTHYFDGWVQMANGTNDYLTANPIVTFRRLEGFMPGVLASGYEIFVAGPMTINGNINLTFANSQFASSANPVSLVLDISGGEVVDQAVGTSAMTSALSGSWGGSYTTLVPNTLLLAASMSDSTANTPVITGISSPFSLLNTGGDAQGISHYDSALISTPQTVTATVSYTVTYSGEFRTTWMQALLPIRPAPAPNTCTLGSGEKIRRQVF